MTQVSAMTMSRRRYLALGSMVAVLFVLGAILLTTSFFTGLGAGLATLGLVGLTIALGTGLSGLARGSIGAASAGYLLNVLGSDDPRWEAGLVGVLLWTSLDLSDRSTNRRGGPFLRPMVEVCAAAAALTAAGVVARDLAAGGSLVATSIALVMVVGILAVMVVSARRERA